MYVNVGLFIYYEIFMYLVLLYVMYILYIIHSIWMEMTCIVLVNVGYVHAHIGFKRMYVCMYVCMYVLGQKEHLSPGIRNTLHTYHTTIPYIHTYIHTYIHLYHVAGTPHAT
jgi:hypothetical protein